MSPDIKFEITDAKGGAAFPVRVTTRATETEIAGVQDDGIVKVRLMASPAGDDAANKELLDFLAGILGVTVDKMEIVAGQEGREKLISIEGISVAEVEDKLRS